MDKITADLTYIERDKVEIQALHDLQKTISSIRKNGNKKTISWNYQDHRVYPYYSKSRVEKILVDRLAGTTKQSPSALFELISDRSAEVLNESKTDFGLYGIHLYLKTNGKNNTEILLTMTKNRCFLLKREDSNITDKTKYEVPVELLQTTVNFMIAGYPGYPTLVHILERNTEE